MEFVCRTEKITIEPSNLIVALNTQANFYCTSNSRIPRWSYSDYTENGEETQISNEVCGNTSPNEKDNIQLYRGTDDFTCNMVVMLPTMLTTMKYSCKLGEDAVVSAVLVVIGKSENIIFLF